MSLLCPALTFQGLQDALTTKDVAGRVMQFTKPQSGIIKAYGLPTNLLLEVCFPRMYVQASTLCSPPP